MQTKGIIPNTLAFVFVLLGLLVGGGSAGGGSIQEEVMQKPWFEMRSGNFHLYSCAATQTVLEVARRLDQFRTAYGELAGWQAIANPPIVVMVYPDLPSMWAFGHMAQHGTQATTNYDGVFYGDGEENMIVLVANLDRAGSMDTVFHEYAHLLLRHNAVYWPTWLAEGMAEIYATMETNDHEVRIGRPRESRFQTLSHTPLMPLSRLLAVKQDSPEYTDAEKGGIFYAQSWLLAHYLMFGGSAHYKRRFPMLTTLLRQGQGSEEAFVNAFGTRLPVMEKQLGDYLASGKFGGVTNHLKSDLAALRPSATRTLSKAEVCFRLGNQLLRAQRLDDAESWFEKARGFAPRGALSSAGLGLVAARRRKPAEAVRLLEEAIQRGMDNYLVYFTYGKERYLMTASTDGESFRPLPRDVAAEIRGRLQKSITLMPLFGQAHYWLGFLEMVQGENLVAAEQQFQSAVQLDPQDQWYLLPLADTQFRRQNKKLARQTLEPLLRPSVPANLRHDAEELLQRIAR